MKKIFQYPDFLILFILIIFSCTAIAQNGSGGVAQFGSGCTDCGNNAVGTDTLYECSITIPQTFPNNVVTTVVYDGGAYVAWDTLTAKCATGYAVGNTLYTCGNIPNTFGYANGNFYSLNGATYSSIAADTVTLYAFEVHAGFVSFQPPECFRKENSDSGSSSSEPLYFSQDNGNSYVPKNLGDSIIVSGSNAFRAIGGQKSDLTTDDQYREGNTIIGKTTHQNAKLEVQSSGADIIRMYHNDGSQRFRFARDGSSLQTHGNGATFEITNSKFEYVSGANYLRSFVNPSVSYVHTPGSYFLGAGADHVLFDAQLTMSNGIVEWAVNQNATSVFYDDLIIAPAQKRGTPAPLALHNSSKLQLSAYSDAAADWEKEYIQQINIAGDNDYQLKSTLNSLDIEEINQDGRFIWNQYGTGTFENESNKSGYLAEWTTGGVVAETKISDIYTKENVSIIGATTTTTITENKDVLVLADADDTVVLNDTADEGSEVIIKGFSATGANPVTVTTTLKFIDVGADLVGTVTAKLITSDGGTLNLIKTATEWVIIN